MSIWWLLLILAPNLIAYLLHQALLEWFFKERNLKRRYNATWGLVTGASSGIGKALSTRLASQGVNVVLVAKPDNMLDATHQELETTFPNLQFRKVPADLGYPGGYLDSIDKATADIDVQLVFCNAGYVLAGFVEKRNVEDLLGNIECNSTSATVIAYHFCMQLIDKKLKGCIVFTSSAAACIPSPFGAVYAATKCFMSAFGASLAPEVKHHGIDVLVAHPSPVASRFYEGAPSMPTLKLFQNMGVQPEELPAIIFASIGRTVFRDIGLTAYMFRILMKVVDYNFMTCIICLLAPIMPDFKQAQKQQNKRRIKPAGNGVKQH